MSASLIDLSLAVGGLAAGERHAFAVCGQRVAAASPRHASWFSEVSLHHAWRFEELSRHLFPFAGYGVGDFLALPGYCAEGLAAVSVATTDAEAAEIHCREVLTILVEHVANLRTQCRPVADAALLRTLAMVEVDLGRDLEAGGRLSG